MAPPKKPICAAKSAQTCIDKVWKIRVEMHGLDHKHARWCASVRRFPGYNRLTHVAAFGKGDGSGTFNANDKDLVAQTAVDEKSEPDKDVLFVSGPEKLELENDKPAAQSQEVPILEVRQGRKKVITRVKAHGDRITGDQVGLREEYYATERQFIQYRVYQIRPDFTDDDFQKKVKEEQKAQLGDSDYDFFSAAYRTSRVLILCDEVGQIVRYVMDGEDLAPAADANS